MNWKLNKPRVELGSGPLLEFLNSTKNVASVGKIGDHG